MGCKIHSTPGWVKSLFVSSRPSITSFRYSVEVSTIFIVLSAWRSNNSDANMLVLNYRVMKSGDQEQMAAKSRDIPGKRNQLWVVSKHTHVRSLWMFKRIRYFPQRGSEIEQFLNPYRIGLSNTVWSWLKLFYIVTKAKPSHWKETLDQLSECYWGSEKPEFDFLTHHSASHFVKIHYLCTLIALRIWTFISSSVKPWCW